MAGEPRATDGSPGTDEIARQLLLYIVRSRGIVGENMLLLVLMKLSGEIEGGELQSWKSKLSGAIKTINLKLHPLDHKVVRVSHGMGKNIVTREAEESCSALRMSSSSIDLPRSNKFYVYIDVGSVDETKLATRFSQRETEFIKWALQEISSAGSEVRKDLVPEDCATVQEVDRIRRGSQEGVASWASCVSFTVGSSRLSRFKELNALEIEQLLARLCDYKWFSRNARGEVGLDLRCIAELEENLITTYGFLRCEICDRLAVHGVMCPHEGPEIDSAVWHVDCYQHQIAHVGQDCPKCGESLITRGVYVI